MSSSRTTPLLQQAVALHQRGNLAQAETLYGEVLRLDPDNFDALHLLGVIARQSGACDEAIRLMGRALAIDSEKAIVHCNLGAALQDAQRHEEAYRSYTRALALQPRYPMALANRGNALRHLGRLIEALADYDAALAQQPGYVEALCNRGVVLHRLGRHEEALDSYGRALAIAPGHSPSYAGAAIALQGMGRNEEAVETYRNAIEADPDNAGAWSAYGTLLLRMGRTQQALDCHKHALALKPGDAQAYLHYANALRVLNQHEEAIDAYRDALACGADADAVNYHLAALGVQPAPAAPPAHYVAALFDQYADGFDHHLQHVLHYRVPDLLMAALAGRLQPVAADVIDLGCGTGLCGPLLRPFARTLAGVDLSPLMLDQALARGVYDELVCADIAAALQGRSADVLVAADVLVYLGDLQPLFRAVRHALRAGGVFAFSVEALDSGAAQDYALNTSGRYAHSASYVQALAQAHGLTADSLATQVLRKDGNEHVAGYIAVLSRTG
ncbi:tetratricopeptide repeat protein [Pseudoduganella ginsengisoli]|uniref:Tetratricopeptide repeat protein n=1 Tax=Pseudoduganella ginsengisoli TaxID=1462440 RepID=A0A6L6Q6H8_9BURK|nr:tetratricopeptide repeat protein [Pseudoduganella ginsengisoli]MTW05044.1 tetratricopeptide repeat protein [Pseudoduganella ginsengisoli]